MTPSNESFTISKTSSLYFENRNRNGIIICLFIMQKVKCQKMDNCNESTMIQLSSRQLVYYQSRDIFHLVKVNAVFKSDFIYSVLRYNSHSTQLTHSMACHVFTDVYINHHNQLENILITLKENLTSLSCHSPLPPYPQP